MNNQEQILESVTKLVNDGKEISKIVTDIISFLRDILLYKAGFGDKTIFKNKSFIQLCENLNNHLIYEWLNQLNEVQNNIKFTNQKRTYLELGLLKMSDKKLNDYSSLIKKIEKLEKDIIDLQNGSVKVEKIVKIEKPKPIIEEDLSMDYIDEPNQTLENLYGEVKIDDSYITTKEVENILNEGSKENKEKIQQIITSSKEKNPNNIIYNIIGQGKVVAASDKRVLLVLDDEARCNRLMKKDNYDKLINIINKDGIIIDSFICIPNNIWEELYKDFLNQFKNKVLKPVLKEVKIMVKRSINDNNTDDNQIIEQAYNLFGKDIVKIKEK